MSYYAMQGFGEYVPVSGFGADIGFDAAAVWSDWLTQTAPRANNAARVIQQALNTLGYGPVTVDGIYSGESAGAFYKFATDHNVSVVPDCPGKGGAKGSCPTQDGLVAMQTALASGTKKAGMGMMLGIGLAGAALIAGLVLTAKKRKHFREIRY